MYSSMCTVVLYSASTASASRWQTHQYFENTFLHYVKTNTELLSLEDSLYLSSGIVRTAQDDNCSSQRVWSIGE